MFFSKKHSELKIFYSILFLSYVLIILLILFIPLDYFANPFSKKLLSLYDGVPFFKNLKIYSTNYDAVGGLYATSMTILVLGLLISFIFFKKAGLKILPKKTVIAMMPLKQIMAIIFIMFLGVGFILIVYFGLYVDWLYDCIDANQISNKFLTLCKEGEYMPDDNKYPHMKSLTFLWGAINACTIPYLGLYQKEKELLRNQ